MNVSPPDDESSPTAVPPDRNLFIWFLAVLGVSLLSLLWLSVRVNSPPMARAALDFFMHLLAAGIVAFGAFRILLMFPYGLTDLLTIVIALSLGIKATLDILATLTGFGIVEGESAQRIGVVFQVCVIVSSLQLVGAGWALRNCLILKIESAWRRALAIISGMLALPAIAIVFSFPIMALRSVLTDEPPNPMLLMAAWLIATVMTYFNIVHLIKALTLRNEQEKGQ